MRVRSTIWLTPEPRFSWGLGGCDLPLYAEHCDRVQVVRNQGGPPRFAAAAFTVGGVAETQQISMRYMF